MPRKANFTDRYVRASTNNLKISSLQRGTAQYVEITFSAVEKSLKYIPKRIQVVNVSGDVVSFTYYVITDCKKVRPLRIIKCDRQLFRIKYLKTRHRLESTRILNVQVEYLHSEYQLEQRHDVGNACAKYCHIKIKTSPYSRQLN